MEIARQWRLNGSRLSAGGSELVGAEVTDESLKVVNKLKGREINLNHGSESGEHLEDWALGLVGAMRGWGFSDEYIGQVADGLATSMNGTGEKFRELVNELL